MPKSHNFDSNVEGMDKKKDSQEKHSKQTVKKSTPSVTPTLPPRDPVSGRWLSPHLGGHSSSSSKGKQPLKGSVDLSKSSQKVDKDVSSLSPPAKSVDLAVAGTSTGAGSLFTGQLDFSTGSFGSSTGRFENSTGRLPVAGSTSVSTGSELNSTGLPRVSPVPSSPGAFSELTVPQFVQMLKDQGLCGLQSTSSPGDKASSTRVCSADPSPGPLSFLSPGACSISSRPGNQTDMAPLGELGGSRPVSSHAGAHLGQLPVGNQSTQQMLTSLLAQALSQGFPGNPTGGSRDNPSVSREPGLGHPSGGPTGYPADIRLPSLSPTNTEHSSEGHGADQDPTDPADESESGDRDQSHPPDHPATFNSRSQRLLAFLSQFLPEVGLGAPGTAPSTDRSSTRLGVFRRASSTYTLGPTQLLQGLATDINPKSVAGKKPHAGFVSPLPLAESFLPSDSATSLTLQEQDRLNLSAFPKITMVKMAHTALENKLSTALKGLSVLSSLFDATVAQTIRPVDQTEDEFEFAEDADPNMVGMTMTVMNQALAGVMQSVASAKVELALEARKAVLSTQRDLSSEDRKILMDCQIPKTGLFDPDILDQRISAASKRKTDRLNSTLVESLHKKPRLSQEGDSSAGHSRQFERPRPSQFTAPRGRSQARGRGRGSSRSRSGSSSSSSASSRPAGQSTGGKRF